MTLSEKYLMEALDAYPYDLPKVIEALNYALSYDAENPLALCLMGQFYSEQMAQYEKAKDYFAQALAIDVHNLKIYPLYIDVLLFNEDYEEAGRLIDFGLALKGMDKAVLYSKQALLYEYQMKFKRALKSLKQAQMHAYNSGFASFSEGEKTRIEGKMKNSKKKKEKETEKVQ